MCPLCSLNRCLLSTCLWHKPPNQSDQCTPSPSSSPAIPNGLPAPTVVPLFLALVASTASLPLAVPRNLVDSEPSWRASWALTVIKWSVSRKVAISSL